MRDIAHHFCDADLCGAKASMFQNRIEIRISKRRPKRVKEWRKPESEGTTHYSSGSLVGSGVFSIMNHYDYVQGKRVEKDFTNHIGQHGR